MKSKEINKGIIHNVESNSITIDLQKQKLYSDRIERYMALVELSYALKISPKIIQKK